MDDIELMHYGILRRSGRYPWGSGKQGYQRNKDFLGYVSDLKKQGLTDAEIAKGLGINSTDLIRARSVARMRIREADAALALKLKEKGYSTTAIGERMGINESSVRSLLDPALREKANIAASTADVIKNAVDEKGFIDIGSGVEQHLGVARTKMDTAVYLLEEKGYVVHEVYFQQLGTNKYTIMKVLGPPGSTKAEAVKNRLDIQTVDGYSEDGGKTFRPIEPPKSMDSSRIMIRYGEEGGKNKDGVIEIRRGVEDLSLGDAHYAQVRVGVDGTHFMKGMAMYSIDKFPPGVDVIYNTNKPKGSSKDEVFKAVKEGENPFGSITRQRHYLDENGKEHLSVLNIVGYKEGSGLEGSWEEWSRTLSSQVLSKQTPALAKKQLKMAADLRQEEFDEIMSLTNPSVRKALLAPFAESCDSDAVHLKAAAMPRQMNHVILPLNSLKENEVYAPNYRPGERVVLIRHPHGGIFEIPELRVNNKSPEGKSLLGASLDAIGIHPKVAERLSGADFDGDTVLVIPNPHHEIQTASPLAGLKNFDPKMSYKKVKGMKVMDEPTKQLEMGKISNLITDMTIKGANDDELARAVKHSMVVIDAVKHDLDYKRSYDENGIAELKKKYQGKATGGAATLISRAKSPRYVDERKEGLYITDPTTGKSKRLYIDPESGRKLYTKTGRTYKEVKKVIDPVTKKAVINPKTGKPLYEETGRVLKAKTKTTKMAEVMDARKLSSGSTMEGVYAAHANTLKHMANQARIAMIKTTDIPYSSSARKAYASEVESLKSKLSMAYRNKPNERQAQLLAHKKVAAMKRDNPDLSPDQIKKIRGQALADARHRMNAKKQEIEITDKEWHAIQAGAVSPSALKNILANTNTKALKQRAMPRYRTVMSPARMQRAKSMLALGHTQSEIADALGVPVSTVVSALKSE